MDEASKSRDLREKRTLLTAAILIAAFALLIPSVLSWIDLGLPTQGFLAMIVVFCLVDIYLPSGRSAVSPDAKTSPSLLRKYNRESANPGIENLRAEIDATIKREEELLTRIEKRLDDLYELGRNFLVFSITGPIAAIIFYLLLQPLHAPAATGLPPPLSDWRILLTGVSSGFLFLAAAGGLLNLRAREIKLATRFRENIDFFRRLASVVEIRCAFHDSESPHMFDVAEFIAEKLIRPQPPSQSRDPNQDDGEDRRLISSAEALLLNVSKTPPPT